MARLSLRDYNREIEELVDSGRTEEAIAHCRYILETYPKHITTYRSLGKALLESQRYGDAADVFKRVLACIPDDFIAHLGMSIIREDEGDLDGGIWHMERAFEVQPSNAAVQSELRRLYGRRDGMTPAKVQLTRGAMARMSAKSNLYSQAIAELRTALAEDPERPDLQALLARMYAQSGQRLAAIEACNALLVKYPYCLEANRLLVEILPGTERAAEAESYRQRLEELDPYEAQRSPGVLTSDQVSAGAITLERLDYLDIQSPIETSPAQPQWASSLGVSIDQTPSSEEPLPDWLNVDGEPAINTGQTDSLEDGVSSDIPEWMREAGWEPASTDVKEGLPGFVSGEEEESETGELASAEIPDWLQGLAPAEEPISETIAIPESSGISSDISGEVIIAAETIDSLTSSEESNVLEEQIVESETEPSADEGESQEAELIQDDSPGVEEAGEATILSNESEVPDWLIPMAAVSAAADIGEQTPRGDEELPDWLSSTDFPEVVSTDTEQAGAGMAAVAFAGETEEFLPTDEPETDISELTLEKSTPQGVSEWLAESAAEIPPESPVGQTPEEQPTESVPEWLAKLSPEPTAGVVLSSEAVASVESTDRDSELAQAEIPQWLREMENTSSAEPDEAAQTGVPEPETMEISDGSLDIGEVPDWLKAAMAVEAIEKGTEPQYHKELQIDEPIIDGDTKPVRIHPPEVEAAIEENYELTTGGSGIIDEDVVEEGIVLEEVEEMEPEVSSMVTLAGIATTETQPEEGATPGFESEDEAMAWLESLAARQGALEEELLTKPEERPLETPEWIQQYAGEATDGKIPSEGETLASDVIGVVATGLVAKQVLDHEEVVEEHTAEVQQPTEWVPEEPLLEEDQSLQGLEPVAFTEDVAISEGVEQAEEAELIEVAGAVTHSASLTEEPFAEVELAETEITEPLPEEVELPDWLRGLESEAAAPTPEIVSGEWVPPEELTDLETISTAPEDSSRLDINAASLTQLERIPGIGFIVAQSIVAYREVNGPFTNLDQLQEIPGISSETYDELKRRLVVEMVAESTPPPPHIPELAQAWQNIANGNIPSAVEQYTNFIREKQELDEVIAEIHEALLIYPLDPLLYQTLGDAYLRSDRLPEAMDAYNRAEDLLK